PSVLCGRDASAPRTLRPADQAVGTSLRSRRACGRIRNLPDLPRAVDHELAVLAGRLFPGSAERGTAGRAVGSWLTAGRRVRAGRRGARAGTPTQGVVQPVRR